MDDRFAEFSGTAGNTPITAAIYRLGNATAAASVELTLTGLAGATGAGVQGGLFADRVIAFSAGQTVAVVTLFADLDGASANTRYRLTIDDPSGAALSGNRTADFTIENSEMIGTTGANLMGGADGVEVVLGGLGNDTLLASTGNDRLDGQGGSDWLFLTRVTAGPLGQGAVVNLAGLSA